MEKIDVTGFVETAKDLKINGIIVLKDGKIAGEHHWKKEERQNQFSVSKSFTCTAIGIAIGEGLFSLDDRVLPFFPEDTPDEPSDYLQQLKISDLLKMSIGQKQAFLMEDQRPGMKEDNYVRFSLAQPIVSKPGEKFMYSNLNTYLAGVILQKCSGESLVDYLMPRLFEPLEIPRPNWKVCPKGYTFGASGLEISVSELSRFGQLFLQQGLWNGKQLVPAEWIKLATSVKIETEGSEDWCKGYCYQFWRGRHDSYRADGMLGQFCIVLEDKNAVIAINSKEERTQEILDCVWSEIYPQL